MAQQPGELDDADLPQRLEREARSRFVRWDGDLWRALLAGPAPELAKRLGEGGASREARAVFRSYLSLARDAVGMGYLIPEGAGVTNFLTVAWTDLLPRLLGKLPPAAQAQALASCWNLGENLTGQAAWLDRLITRRAGSLTDLAALEAMVSSVAGRVFEEPETPLQPSWPVELVHLGREDSRFLPGRIRFLSPTVVCVYDRARVSPDGTAPTMGVWLSERPEVLGPLGEEPLPEEPARNTDRVWKEAALLDPRLTGRIEEIRNPWRAACTLHTSQCLAVLTPPPERP